MTLLLFNLLYAHIPKAMPHMSNFEMQYFICINVPMLKIKFHISVVFQY